MMRNAMTGAESTLAEVLPGRLWQSGRPVPRKAVEAAGVNVIVAVGGGKQPWMDGWMSEGVVLVSRERPQLRAFLHIPLIDSAGMLDPVAADAAIGAIVTLLRDPFRRVLVHCDMGAFRSVHVAACALAQVEGITASAACRRVDAQRHEPYRDTAMSSPDWRDHALSYPRSARTTEDD